jgi:hypothetical protein
MLTYDWTKNGEQVRCLPTIRHKVRDPLVLRTKIICLWAAMFANLSLKESTSYEERRGRVFGQAAKEACRGVLCLAAPCGNIWNIIPAQHINYGGAVFWLGRSSF